jgi:hypothetical protein
MHADSFETVAITYRQPQTAVILSMFEFYGIPAYALWANTLRMTPADTIAFGGVRIRVHSAHADEARILLLEAAAREDETPRDTPAMRANNGLWALALTLVGALPPPRLGPTIIGR